MKADYRYIVFRPGTPKPKTKTWHCFNKKTYDKLGLVEWSCTWRRYVYISYGGVLYDGTCCDDIKDFLRQADNEHKRNQKQKRGHE